MSLLETILTSGNGAAVKALANNFGLSGEDAMKALSQLVPALGQNVKRNIDNNPSGLDGLMGALKKGNHGRYLDSPDILGHSNTANDGKSILGHILGSKDASRSLAKQAASNSGLDFGLLKKMLPVIASMAMGGLSKQSMGKGLLGGALASGAGGIISSIIDRDNDGKVIDDLFNMARKFL
ncbi:MAG: DUF937 domain-containing protein [Gammaproteobacteria bacterium]